MTPARPSTPDTTAHAEAPDDLPWLALVDDLHARVEADGVRWLDGGAGWPPAWRAVVEGCAVRIGAKSMRLEGAVDSDTSLPPRPRGAAGSARCMTVPPPTGRGHWPAVVAESGSPDGFTVRQRHEFHTLCAHLHAAWALQSTIDEERQRLARMHEALDALPVGLVLLDERLAVTLGNRRGLAWLHRSGREGPQARLPVPPAPLQPVLHAFAADPSALEQRVQVDGVDIRLRKLDAAVQDLSTTPADAPRVPAPDGAPRTRQRVLLRIEEGVTPERLAAITPPPAVLARHLQHRHDLSPRELLLAWNLARGMSLKQFAGLSERSVETARVQLRAVFRKLGVTAQKDVGHAMFDAVQVLALQPLAAHRADTVGAGVLSPLRARPAR